ncbi:MAG: SMP-30/gluconolactonase/LRE family protein, partial [Ignavibacteriaceae bacterium]|nr:SMP-30/gluconolactonase/LRE family protein [Ignavibacteriaceae bacterium]
IFIKPSLRFGNNLTKDFYNIHTSFLIIFYMLFLMIKIKESIMNKLIPLLILSAYTFSFSQEIKWEKLAENLQFPEGPAWNGNELFVSSCYGGFISKIGSNTSEIFVDSTMKPFRIKQSNGLTFGKDGYMYACDYGIGAILKISPTGITEILSDGYQGEKYNRPNDLAFSPEGMLFFSDPKSYSKDKPDGRLFKLDINSGESELVIDSLCFPNGIAFSNNWKNLFVCESAMNRILKFDFNDDGSITNKTVFVNLPGGDPDGIAFDSEGKLFCAHFGGGTIYVIDRDGKIIHEIKTPGKKPSNVEFGGKDMKILFITEDETNSVYKTTLETPGQKLFYSPF